MKLCIGEVVAVKGVKIVIKVYEQSNLDIIFYRGKEYQGVSINEHLCIQRGYKDIVAKVEGEYLDESRVETENNSPSYLRKVELQPIGHFESDVFFEGVKYLPMIGDRVFLLNKEKIYQIYSRGDGSFSIGKTIKDGIAISLPWQTLFNTHIGVFGNTGSGKSNTLTKLFTELFSECNVRFKGIQRTSRFVLLDFNGEYTGNQFLNAKHKRVVSLNTSVETADKITLSESVFWNSEILGILFKATENTQRPFLSRVIYGREVNKNPAFDSLSAYFNKTFEAIFVSTSQKREVLDLFKDVCNYTNAKEYFIQKLSSVGWHTKNQQYAFPVGYSSGDQGSFDDFFYDKPANIIIKCKDDFEELEARCALKLINDLLMGYVQFDHIQPLLKRISFLTNDIRKVFSVGDTSFKSEVDGGDSEQVLTVISLRQCNQDIKKIVPLLLAYSHYSAHKKLISNCVHVNRTLHIIIDEAHNILSQQSNREAESWKDYRLELFEEIIKEGRKFGVFLTLSSQRPADISPTIMSQIHNFFIHRLVNDKDLFLIDNTISTLDSFSKNMIPKLSKGCCVVTGTSFDLPLLIQVDKMDSRQRPDSDDIDLMQLWAGSELFENTSSQAGDVQPSEEF